MPDKGTVLLVEADEAERERLGSALEDAGYEVIGCPGPTAPDYTCIGGREGYCPLLERADAVVLDLWLAGDEVGRGPRPSSCSRCMRPAGEPSSPSGQADGRILTREAT